MQLLAPAVVAVFVFAACSAEARLIRGGGRATVSNNSATIVFLAEQSAVSGGNLRLPSDSLPNVTEAIMESGSERVYAVPDAAGGGGPDACYTFVGSVGAEEEFNANNEACRYEFFEGEQLEFLGFMDHLLPDSVSTDFTWMIESIVGDFEYTFPESTEVTPSFSTKADLALSATPPAGLVAGEYSLSVKASQTAPPGFTYFQYFFVQSEILCGVLGPDDPDGCLLFGQDLGTTFENVSSGTRVSILSVSDVPAPATIALMAVAGFGGLFRRRLRKN